MRTDIYYFSGTGNSLHVAQELQQRLPETELIPMLRLLPHEVIIPQAEAVGFVFPTYLTTVPMPVRMFLQKLDLHAAAYLFAVTTCIGALPLPHFYIARVLQQQGKRLDARFTLKMCSNSPTGVRPTPGDKHWVNDIAPDHIAALEREVQQQLAVIEPVVRQRKAYPEKPVPQPLQSLLARIMNLVTIHTRPQLHFYADATCTGCGTCAQVCLSNRIQMTQGHPVWQANVQCYYCYACFNFCPQQAVLLKNYTEKQGRYRYPGMTASEIAGQKQA